MTKLSRRAFLGTTSFVLAHLSLPSLASSFQRERYLVLGAGRKGVQAALKAQMDNPKRDVFLLDQTFETTPLKASPIAPKTVHPDLLARFDILGGKRIQTAVQGVDRACGIVFDHKGARIDFDQMEVHLGYGFTETDMPGIEAVQEGRILHGWQDHRQADQLWQQVQTMKQGGVVIISIPESDYRFKEGPFVRSEYIASYLERVNPRAKIIILDGHARDQEITFKSSMIERVSKDQNGAVVAISSDGKALMTKDATFQADVINFIPDQYKITL